MSELLSLILLALLGLVFFIFLIRDIYSKRQSKKSEKYLEDLMYKCGQVGLAPMYLEQILLIAIERTFPDQDKSKRDILASKIIACYPHYFNSKNNNKSPEELKYDGNYVYLINNIDVKNFNKAHKESPEAKQILIDKINMMSAVKKKSSSQNTPKKPRKPYKPRKPKLSPKNPLDPRKDLDLS